MPNETPAPSSPPVSVVLDGFYEHSNGDIPIVITLAPGVALGMSVHGSYHAAAQPIPGGDYGGSQVIYVDENQKFNIRLDTPLSSEQGFVVESVVRPDPLDG